MALVDDSTLDLKYAKMVEFTLLTSAEQTNTQGTEAVTGRGSFSRVCGCVSIELGEAAA